ncbi:hypothetical protein VTK26DRAFT_5239 [Humicola hyalothermophila]
MAISNPMEPASDAPALERQPRERPLPILLLSKHGRTRTGETGSSPKETMAPRPPGQPETETVEKSHGEASEKAVIEQKTTHPTSTPPAPQSGGNTGELAAESAVPVETAPQPQSQAPAAGDGETAGTDGEEEGFIRGTRLICLLAGLMLGVFLISLDRTIISTATPFITHEFRSTPDIGWYGAAYLLTACAFQPMFGRVFMVYSLKKAYLGGVVLFEVGSLLCGASRNSATLIAGRAVAGLGSAGILTGSFIVVSSAVPLRSRPVTMAVVGLMFGVGATLGPVLGGVFTDLATWRWCFYINLPVGAIAGAAMFFFFNPKQNRRPNRGLVERLWDLDLGGNVLLFASSVMLFLALEYTTQGTPWSSAEVIGLLVGSGTVAVMLIAWMWWKQDKALMPPRIMMQRTVAASCWMSFMIYAALINLTFFLPVWFQAVRGVSAVQSGINMMPYFVFNGAFSLLASFFVSAIGYATPPSVVGSAIGTVGLGLLTTLKVDTTTAKWVGYQILTSAGFGLSIQQGFTAVQTVLDDADLPVATTAVVASQSLGAALFVAVGNSVFQNRLLEATADDVVKGVDVKALIDAGAASFRQLVPADQLPTMLKLYNEALTKVFLLSVPLGALATVISGFIEWKSVKSNEMTGAETTANEAAQREKPRARNTNTTATEGSTGAEAYHEP